MTNPIGVPPKGVMKWASPESKPSCPSRQSHSCFLSEFLQMARAEEPPPGLVWEARYNHSYSKDYARAVATDEAGNVYVTGTGAGPNGSKDFVTLKYDSAGVLLWEAYYDYNYFNWECYPNFIQGADAALDIEIDGEGSVYVLGTTSYEYFCPVNHMYYVSDFAVVKYNPEGNRVWGFSRPIYDYAEGPTAMAVGRTGNVHIIGHHDWGDRGYVTRKYHSNGWPLWEANYWAAQVETTMRLTLRWMTWTTSTLRDAAGEKIRDTTTQP